MISWISTTSETKTAALAKILTLAFDLAFALAFEINIKGYANVGVRVEDVTKSNGTRTRLPAVLAALLPHKASKPTNKLLSQSFESLLGMPITIEELFSYLIWRMVCKVSRSVNLIPIIRARVCVGTAIVVVNNVVVAAVVNKRKDHEWTMLMLLMLLVHSSHRSRHR